MSYKDAYHPKTKADLKKLDKAVLRELFDTYSNTILADPYGAGEALHGSLEGIATYHIQAEQGGISHSFCHQGRGKNGLHPHGRQKRELLRNPAETTELRMSVGSLASLKND